MGQLFIKYDDDNDDNDDNDNNDDDVLYIIARYKEDINWLNPIMKKCMIYNKGPKLGLSNEILLENVGRESETYLRYIVDNYDNLPKICVFSQANIADHIDELYKNKSSQYKYLKKIKKEAKNNISKKSTPRYVNYDSRDTCFGKHFPYNDNTITNYVKNEDISRCKKYYPGGFEDWLINIGIKYNTPFKVYTNGLFAVSRDIIRTRPRYYYMNIISKISYSSNPIEGHFMERSWYYIFR